VQESARTFLADNASLERLRAVVNSGSGYDAALWTALAGEMGFTGLMIPQAFGGTGLGAVEMSLVLEETGRTLAVVPFFETAVLAAQGILLVGNPAQQQALLPDIAAGRTRATFAMTGPSGAPCPQDVAVELQHTGEASEWRLQGTAEFVTFAHVADLLLVIARSPGSVGFDGLSLVAVHTKARGVTIQRLPTLDLTRPYSRVSFDRVRLPRESVLGGPGAAQAVVERLLAIGAGLLAAEQTGGAEFCLSSTVEYAKERTQFGRPIGSFQAIKHELADMMVAVEGARSAALYAAVAIDHGNEELLEAAAVARVWCTEAFRHCAAEAIQLHGGIGFTWEHHAHLYFKRARSSSTWFGEPALHRERIARLIGLEQTSV
jgi:alkylation response protein AidB-like acyl-CoA dehydrogenase